MSSALPVVSGLGLGIGRRKQDVAVIADAGALQVGVAEAEDDQVGVVVSAATVPTFKTCIGTELDHAKGSSGAGVGVAVATGTDERIHPPVQRMAFNFRNAFRANGGAGHNQGKHCEQGQG